MFNGQTLPGKNKGTPICCPWLPKDKDLGCRGVSLNSYSCLLLFGSGQDNFGDLEGAGRTLLVGRGWGASRGKGAVALVYFFFLEKDAKLREEVLRSMGTVGGGIRDCM